MVPGAGAAASNDVAPFGGVVDDDDAVTIMTFDMPTSSNTSSISGSRAVADLAKCRVVVKPIMPFVVCLLRKKTFFAIREKKYKKKKNQPLASRHKIVARDAMVIVSFAFLTLSPPLSLVSLLSFFWSQVSQRMESGVRFDSCFFTAGVSPYQSEATLPSCCLQTMLHGSV